MNIIDIVTKTHINKNYRILRKNFNTFYDKYFDNTCNCDMYSPYIQSGTCRFCWKYEKKSQQDILKILLKNLDNLN